MEIVNSHYNFSINNTVDSILTLDITLGCQTVELLEEMSNYIQEQLVFLLKKSYEIHIFNFVFECILISEFSPSKCT